MSIKKSSLLIIAVIVVVTLFQVMTSGGNAMLIDMSDTSISFSGIDDFKHEVAYEKIVSVTLDEVSDWSVWGGHEFGHFRVGHMTDYVLFATTQSDTVIITTLTDGTRMVFNYNNTSDTEAIYNILLEYVQ